MRTAIRLLLGLVALFAYAPASFASHIDGLTIDVEALGKRIGQIRLHVGNFDFDPAKNEGIGKATSTSEQSGFYVADGMSLADMGAMVCCEHFNWLQIVKLQPPAHEPTFGAVPHADPSNDPDNPFAHDDEPWYLNEDGDGNPPNAPIGLDLPPDTDGFLQFVDFPAGYEPGDMIEFDTYLICVVDQEKKLYAVLAGFTWKVTGVGDPAVGHIVNLAKIDLGNGSLPQSYKDIAHDYEGRGWTQVKKKKWSGSLTILNNILPPLTATGTGVAVVNGSSATEHLQTLRLKGGGIDTVATFPGTPTTVVSAVLSIGLGDVASHGTLKGISGTPPLVESTMPLQGQFRLCLFTAGCGIPLTLPLLSPTTNGVVGAGVGGLITVGSTSALHVSVIGAPWTIGTVMMLVDTPMSGSTTLSAAGFVHGPASGTSSTAASSGSGVVQLVTPLQIPVQGPLFKGFGGLAVLKIHFLPEPGALSALLAGAAALIVLGWRRRGR